MATTDISQRYRGHDLILRVGSGSDAPAVTLQINDCRYVQPRQQICLGHARDSCLVRDRLFALGRLWIDEHPLPWPFADACKER